MDSTAQRKRNQEIAESSWTQIFEVPHMFGLGRIVYNSLVHGSRPTIHPVEPGIFWGVLYLLTLCLILYSSVKVICVRKDYAIKPVPLFLLASQAFVILLYLACLMVFYSGNTLQDILKAS